MKNWCLYVALTLDAFPRAFDPNRIGRGIPALKSLYTEKYNWLVAWVGDHDVEWGVKRVDNAIYLGFHVAQNAMLFKLEWGGEKVLKA